MSAVETPVAGGVPYLPAVWDSPYLSAVWDLPLMAAPPQRGGVIQPTLSFMAMVFLSFMFHKDHRMRIYAHSLAR